MLIIVRVSAFPQSYKEAVESPESECWIAAMREEMNSLEENNTFTLTTLSEGRKAVGVDRYTLSKINLIIPRATIQDMWLRVTAKLRMQIIRIHLHPLPISHRCVF